MSAESPWLTLRQAAAYLGPHRSHRLLAREIKRGKLRAAKVAGRGDYVLKREWVDTWLEELATPVEVASVRPSQHQSDEHVSRSLTRRRC